MWPLCILTSCVFELRTFMHITEGHTILSKHPFYCFREALVFASRISYPIVQVCYKYLEFGFSSRKWSNLLLIHFFSCFKRNYYFRMETLDGVVPQCEVSTFQLIRILKRIILNMKLYIFCSYFFKLVQPLVVASFIKRQFLCL